MPDKSSQFSNIRADATEPLDGWAMSCRFTQIKNRSEFYTTLGEFLRRFRDYPNPLLLSDEPPLLAPTLGDDGLADAYLASIAATLAHANGWPVPEWARGTARALLTPWFASDDPLLKRDYLVHSPIEFRVRHLFVPADVLVRF